MVNIIFNTGRILLSAKTNSIEYLGEVGFSNNLQKTRTDV